MTKLIDLGRASEETKGSDFNSTQEDGTGVKKLESNVKYRTAPADIADLVKVQDNN